MFMVTVAEDLCTGCAECATACPSSILSIVDGKAVVTGDDCLGCQSCAIICPVEAIKVDEF